MYEEHNRLPKVHEGECGKAQVKASAMSSREACARH